MTTAGAGVRCDPATDSNTRGAPIRRTTVGAPSRTSPVQNAQTDRAGGLPVRRDGYVRDVENGCERRRVFDLNPANVRAARSFVQHLASQSGADPEVAAVLASELATNAVLHAHTGFEVRVPADREVFRVEIVNGAPEMIVALKSPSSEEGGRGLQIVEALSQRWGTDADRGEKVVWFELPTG